MPTLRASEAQRIALCPGSARACYGLKDEVSEYAARGNRIHEWLAEAFRGEDGPDLAEDEQDTANRLMARIEPYMPGTPRCIRVEEAYFNGGFPWTGHADLVVNDTKGDWLVVDWKTGWGEQEAPEANAQLRVYAVLVWLQYRETHDIRQIRAAIANPRGVMEPVIYTSADLYEAEAELHAIHEAAMAAVAPRLPHPEACKFCRAFGGPTCPETCRAIEALPEPAVSLDMLEAADLGNMGRLAKLAEKRIDQVKAEIRSRLEDGEEVPGCSIGAPSEVKEIADIGRAFELLPELSQEQFLGACTVSLPRLADAYAAVLDRPKGQARTEVESILSEVIETKTRKGNLKIGG
jgi:CRISPR/Cas system-associated exonuclease Cas4 (RecB family)